MIAMTTSNSTSVKPRRFDEDVIIFPREKSIEITRSTQ